MGVPFQYKITRSKTCLPLLRFIFAFAEQDNAEASFDASPRAYIAELLASRFTCKLIGVRRAEIDALALRDQIALMLNIEHRLGCAIRHQPVRTEDGHLVLQRRHVEGFIAGVVVGGHFVRDLRRRMRVHPLQRLDIGVHQLLDDIFMAVDVTVVHKEADERVGPTQCCLRRLWRAQVDQDFANTGG